MNPLTRDALRSFFLRLILLHNLHLIAFKWGIVRTGCLVRCTICVSRISRISLHNRGASVHLLQVFRKPVHQLLRPLHSSLRVFLRDLRFDILLQKTQTKGALAPSYIDVMHLPSWTSSYQAPEARAITMVEPNATEGCEENHASKSGRASIEGTCAVRISISSRYSSRFSHPARRSLASLRSTAFFLSPSSASASANSSLANLPCPSFAQVSGQATSTSSLPSQQSQIPSSTNCENITLASSPVFGQ
mmetsp:Transcript_10050/g.27334  ORF Transcript_10050/g.27334 Transcript_10050/m.27334 type:complete len:248 (-) Transcript_10050:349-1092(-)